MIALYTFSIFALLVVFVASVFTVQQQTVAIVERFGKFHKIYTSGLNMKIPLVDRIVSRVNLRLMQLDVEVETKTLDNVFVKIVSSVQYKVVPDRIYDSFYSLQDSREQILAYVFDVIRAQVPKLNLDDLFSKKDDIAVSVKSELQEVMHEFGFDIVKSLVTDINPDSKVKSAMNEINEAQRLRMAAFERAEAEKIVKIKHAEAESESMILHGNGIAGQRKVILDGLKSSLRHFQEDVTGTTAHDAMALILMSQYFDTLKEMTANGRMNSILLPHSPAALGDIQQQIVQAIMTAGQLDTTH